jgi:hypothetical protein
LWDPGAKFIFVLRDENQDSGVLACFFAILKNDESVALSDQVDFRLIKNTFNCVLQQLFRKSCKTNPTDFHLLIPTSVSSGPWRWRS